MTTTPTKPTPPTPPTPPQNDTTSTTPTPTATNTSTDTNISADVLAKYSDVVELIKHTASMGQDEREYWYQILPIMTDDQVARLKKILEAEANQMANLDEKYQAELAKLNQKHLDEWSQFKKKKDREVINTKELAAETAEKASEEDILKQLNNM